MPWADVSVGISDEYTGHQPTFSSIKQTVTCNKDLLLACCQQHDIKGEQRVGPVFTTANIITSASLFVGHLPSMNYSNVKYNH